MVREEADLSFSDSGELSLKYLLSMTEKQGQSQLKWVSVRNNGEFERSILEFAGSNYVHLYILSTQAIK